jgi:magnesium transporter
VVHPILETALQHVCCHVPIAEPDTSAGEIRARLVGSTFECASDVAVCRDGRLLGLLRIEDLFAAHTDTRVTALMDADPPTVTAGADQELAAWKAVQHGGDSIAVVDAAGRFVGLIPPRRLLRVLLQEHHEDITRNAGLLKVALGVQAPLQEPVSQRILHRLPWLALGLLGALASAELMARFESELRAHVALAFLLPGIVYLADAVGTQTETLVVRGLSVDLPIRRILWRELATGAWIGAILALASLPFALWRWSDSGVAWVLASALLAACAIATVVAVSLPWIFARLGRDPAFGSGPLATVIQDLLTIAIYFVVASAILGSTSTWR